jgi:hypothetical protein
MTPQQKKMLILFIAIDLIFVLALVAWTLFR